MKSKVYRVFRQLIILGLLCNLAFSVENFNLEGQRYKLVKAEGDATEAPPGTSPNSNPLNQKNGTTLVQCRANGNCCGTYTWPGQGFMDDPSTAPQSCAALPSIKDDPRNTIACFGPLVYSNGTRRPDPKLVMKECYSKNLPCFCSGKSCMKYSFLMNNKDKTIVNETRFCGTLTNVETNSPVTSGCYQENIEGTPYIREVCICGSRVDDYCNSSKASGVLASITLVLSIAFYSVYFY